MAHTDVSPMPESWLSNLPIDEIGQWVHMRLESSIGELDVSTDPDIVSYYQGMRDAYEDVEWILTDSRHPGWEAVGEPVVTSVRKMTLGKALFRGVMGNKTMMLGIGAAVVVTAAVWYDSRSTINLSNLEEDRVAEAMERFARVIAKPCPNIDCQAPAGSLCNTNGVWVHVERIEAVDPKPN